MRTKTLLLTAALSAAGIATSMAQVYSVNAVGYVNTPLVKGFNLISNPLNNTAANGNQIQNLFASLPPGARVYRFNGTKYDLAEQDLLGGGIQGVAATMTVNPGEGVFVEIPSDAPANTQVTFVGEVMQGTGQNQLSNPIPAGFSIRASQVPQAGLVSTALGFPGGEQDQIFVFNETTQRYAVASFVLGAWDTEPNIDVGEAFFVNNASGAKAWTRSFSVNN